MKIFSQLTRERQLNKDIKKRVEKTFSLQSTARCIFNYINFLHLQPRDNLWPIDSSNWLMVININQWPAGTGLLDLSDLPDNHPMEKENYIN